MHIVAYVRLVLRCLLLLCIVLLLRGLRVHRQLVYVSWILIEHGMTRKCRSFHLLIRVVLILTLLLSGSDLLSLAKMTQLLVSSLP